MIEWNQYSTPPWITTIVVIALPWVIVLWIRASRRARDIKRKEKFDRYIRETDKVIAETPIRYQQTQAEAIFSRREKKHRSIFQQPAKKQEPEDDHPAWMDGFTIGDAEDDIVLKLDIFDPNCPPIQDKGFEGFGGGEFSGAGASGSWEQPEPGNNNQDPDTGSNLSSSDSTTSSD